MKITILSGAGLSAESGLGTFRDRGGLWSQYDLKEVAPPPEGYRRNPALVHAFYRARRENCAEAEPNAAHVALAQLQEGPHDVTLITQNVDDLLERAGAKDVIHMHGQLMRALCADCGHRWDAPLAMDQNTKCPECSGPARPDIVWFGEIPYHMDRCEAALQSCDLFVSIGTSAEVYPAAGFVDLARQVGAQTLEINLERSSRSRVFDQIILGPASWVVPEWVGRLVSA